MDLSWGFGLKRSTQLLFFFQVSLRGEVWGPVRGVESNRSSSPRTTTQHTTPKRYDMILDHNIEPWSPPAADSNISDPITSFLPPAYYLIIDRTGYMDMQQLTSMDGYLQSYGLVRFGGWARQLPHHCLMMKQKQI